VTQTRFDAHPGRKPSAGIPWLKPERAARVALTIILLFAAACSRHETSSPASPPDTQSSLAAPDDAADIPPTTPFPSQPAFERQPDFMVDPSRETGLGVVGREIAGESGCGLNAKGESEVELLESPGGAVAARLRWQTGEFGSCALTLSRDGKTKLLAQTLDLREISYESVALVYYESAEGFARILEHQASPGLWVRVADLPDGKLRPWVVLLTESPKNYQNYEAKAVHAEPTDASPVLVTLRDREDHKTTVHEIIPTGSVSGDWGQFNVIEHDGDFSIMTRERDPTLTGNNWTGWVRLVDESGQPAIWYYTRD
jgi:hypothetical protein